MEIASTTPAPTHQGAIMRLKYHAAGRRGKQAANKQKQMNGDIAGGHAQRRRASRDSAPAPHDKTVGWGCRRSGSKKEEGGDIGRSLLLSETPGQKGVAWHDGATARLF